MSISLIFWQSFALIGVSPKPKRWNRRLNPISACFRPQNYVPARKASIHRLMCWKSFVTDGVEHPKTFFNWLNSSLWFFHFNEFPPESLFTSLRSFIFQLAPPIFVLSLTSKHVNSVFLAFLCELFPFYGYWNHIIFYHQVWETDHIALNVFWKSSVPFSSFVLLGFF